MRTPDNILIQAAHALSRDIQSEDGVANAAIQEMAYRLEELVNENAELREQLNNPKQPTNK